MYEWSDLRVFLAVARAGSTLGASRQLKVNQTTVARRIAALEAALGVTLFNKLQAGYSLTEAGSAVLSSAERVELEAETVARLAAQQGRRMAGVIRVTTNESIANVLLTPCLGEFSQIFPDIQVQVIVTDDRLDIARGEADVAIRAGSRPDDPDLVIRKIMTVGWAFYCSDAYAERRGCPASAAELNQHVLLAGEGGLASSTIMRWMQAVAPDAPIASRSSSLTNHHVAIRAGLGVGPLPAMEGDRDPGLRRCFWADPEMASEILLVTRAVLKDAPRLRAFNDFIAVRAAALKRSLPSPG